MPTKVLLAESDAAAAREMTQHLRGTGLEVVAASDAVNVLAMARQSQPDVIVLSGALFGGGAVTAMGRLRTNVFTTHIPVVGIVRKAGARQKELEAAGVQACLRDPTPEQVAAEVRRHELEELDFTQAPGAVLEDPKRLAALEETRLLDTPPEASFDRLTRLTTRLLGTPTALLTLVDRDRQFFKSQVGLAGKWAEERQTRLSHSFCQWVVSGDEPLSIHDAKQHPTLRKNLAISQLGVVAYAGVPLHGRDGQAIGSFCAIDSEPRFWTGEDLESLKDLAHVSQAYAVLDRARRGESGERASPDHSALSIHVAGNAILGVTRLLRRHGDRLAPEDREALLGILEEQSRHLVEMGGSAVDD